ncbi:hypothetical protein EN858_30245 [Mesorhizobium sp. M4B.F.Ca.ET.215.01.1.1]|nr:hypothetical protein EOA34_06900 [Mesorhizobium sp. M4B.F.Ca.ET.013.02.1.1]TGQ05070.1 hypothetical protein EN858_30245 [Mesorhizobium sp. M4B.F.Ca.ET.215.01.1.1]TGQ40882.1 hypothetical protein EN863_020820 [Mesorhizobium sp. M00.F.Ca.ET.220.01.1.1]TGQ97513.1 hypothetical protein EN846_29535 [Mesorhizobium sp. M4B.F.Ca.ET.203.01.1.1]TGT45244.1 hypothetical protein EN812_08785 [Mesorhizobium sp. M4B.F.Ca.ET.169.01.1.1]TIT29330.1 MAG: hypothetical protein E5W86_02900 [Mesorhizobium sp.]
MTERYEGRALSLEEAAVRAVDQIPWREGRDYAVGRVVEWGLQRGGFIDTKLYYVIVEEDPNADFRTEGP